MTASTLAADVLEPHWTDAKLDALRQIADPVADEVIGILLSSSSHEEVTRTFRLLVTNRDPIPGGMPQEVHDYFASTATLPAWADLARIEQAERLFGDLGPEMMMLLYYKALPECYACWRGAEVLYLTGRMTEHHRSTAGLQRRLFETVQFVLDVMAPGGLSPMGRGIRSIQKVRLIHAAIRYFTRRHGWDERTYGAPINQEDLAGTLMSFSVALLDGLRTLRTHVTPDQEESYLHTWTVVGSLLGIRDELLPKNMQDARALTATILRRHTGSSEAGRALAKALIDFVGQHVPPWLSRSFPGYVIRHCTDRSTVVALGVHESMSIAGALLLTVVHAVFSAIDRLSNRSPLVARVFSYCSYALMEGLVVMSNEEKQVFLELPDALRERWDVGRPALV